MYLFVVVFSFLIEWGEGGRAARGIKLNKQQEQTGLQQRCRLPLPYTSSSQVAARLLMQLTLALPAFLPLTPFMVALSDTQIRLDLVCLRLSLLSPLSQCNYVTTSLLQLQLQLPNPQLQILTSSARLILFQLVKCLLSRGTHFDNWLAKCFPRKSTGYGFTKANTVCSRWRLICMFSFDCLPFPQSTAVKSPMGPYKSG